MPPQPIPYVPPRVEMPPPATGEFVPMGIHNGGLTPTEPVRRRDGGLDATTPQTQPQPMGGVQRSVVEAAPGTYSNDTVAVLASREEGRQWVFTLGGGVVHPATVAQLLASLSRAMPIESVRPGMNEIVYPMDREEIAILATLLEFNRFPDVQDSAKREKLIALTAKLTTIVNTP